MRPLEALNFFMADMQAGIGPYLGVFLLAHQWDSGLIGTVMTLGGLAGMVMTIPAGALIDATSRKKLYIIIPGVCSVFASAAVLLSQDFWVVVASQMATAIAGATLGPAISGITLGMVRQSGFNRQVGRNEAFNHAGNVVGAGISGFLGWRYGLPAVFYLAAAFAVCSIVSVLLIPSDAIDDRAARGLRNRKEEKAQATGFKDLLRSKPLAILAICVFCYQLGNAGMLPLYSLAVIDGDQNNPAVFVAKTIVVAQAVMIGASLLAMRVAEDRGYWVVLLISFAVLPIRGLIAAHLIEPWGLYPVEVLDGIGAGLQSVAIPGLVARILHGSGRVNVGQGAVMTIQGAGGALSPALGGWVAQWLSYSTALTMLGSFALVSVILWWRLIAIIGPSCLAVQDDDDDAEAAPAPA